MKLDLKIGDPVFVKRIGNEARNRTGEELFLSARVSKIGRKYFELDGFYRDRFDINTGLHDGRGWISNYIVYRALEDAIEEERILNAKQKIARFSFFGMNASEIDDILSVIKKYEDRIKIQT